MSHTDSKQTVQANITYLVQQIVEASTTTGFSSLPDHGVAPTDLRAAQESLLHGAVVHKWQAGSGTARALNSIGGVGKGNPPRGNDITTMGKRADR